MRAWLICGAIVVAFFGTYAQGTSCSVVNGSFDDDGHIPDLSTVDPNGWTAAVPKPLFSAYVFRDWPTDGVYNLTLFSTYAGNFQAGDMVTVNQQVELSAVKTLAFDVKLSTQGSVAWHPDIASVVVMIDDEAVWDSNSFGPDVRGEFRDQTYVVDEKFKTAGLHTLSLCLRINVTARVRETYIAYFDHVTLNCYCNGGGLLAGDFNRDCVVDANDLAFLADVYLKDPNIDDPRNLWTGDDTEGSGGWVSLYDFAILASVWDGGFGALETVVGAWLQDVELTDPANLYEGDDVQPAANINFKDFAMMAQNWLLSSWVEEPAP